MQDKNNSGRFVQTSRRALGVALGAALALVSGPVVSASLDAKLSGFAALQDDELETMRGGFVTPAGHLAVSIGFDIKSFVNNTPIGQVTVGSVLIGNGTPTAPQVSVNGAPGGVWTDGPLVVTHTANGGATVSSLTVGNGFILNTVQNSVDSQVIRSAVTANIEVFGLRDTVRAHFQHARALDLARSGSFGRR